MRVFYLVWRMVADLVCELSCHAQPDALRRSVKKMVSAVYITGQARESRWLDRCPAYDSL